jgi:ABC-type transport system involved in multi-copper enzyme maturation permease subunit
VSATVAAELLKLRVTRSTWVLAAAALALAGARIAMVLLSTGTAAGVERGTAGATLTLAGAAGAGSVVVALLGVMAVTGESRHRTATGTFLGVPDRRRIVVAKVIALAVAGAVAGLTLSALGVIVGVVGGVAGPLPVGTGLRLALAVALGGAFWGWLGVGVGLVVRNQTIALLVPVAWLIVVEPLVGAFGLRGVVPWLPGTLPGALAGFTAPGGPPAWAACVALIAYGLALTLPGGRLLVRRDVS